MIRILGFILLTILLNETISSQETYSQNTLSQARHFQSILRTNFYGVDRNSSTAYELFNKAAEQGDADAAYNLGYMAYRGDGVPASKSEAFKMVVKS